MSLPIIAIVGATGTQGGSVVNALLSDEFKTRWAVRALTRNPDSDAAKALVARGATVAKIDLNDPSTIAPAFAGAAAVFAVTNVFGLAAHGPYFEEVQGNAMADAAKAAGVRHFVWSTLADVERMSGGKYSVPFFTAKARVAAYTRAIGLPSTYVHAGFYMSNF
ncbi:NmrA-like domain-containing protein, partial [Blastocladiella britannica]